MINDYYFGPFSPKAINAIPLECTVTFGSAIRNWEGDQGRRYPLHWQFDEDISPI